MIGKLKHIAGEGRAVAFATYKEWSAYRTHSLVSVFVGPAYFIVQYFIWKAVYGDTPAIAGVMARQIVLSDRSGSATTRFVVMASSPLSAHSTEA